MIFNRFCFVYIFYPLLPLITLIIFFIVLTGCLNLHPIITVEQYSLDYNPPTFPHLLPLNVGIKLTRFHTIQEIAGTEMVIQFEPYQRRVLDYQRWRVTPVDQIVDCLARDLRTSGLFTQVLTYHNSSSTRFKIEGILERFHLSVKPSQELTAVLELNLTLFDIYEHKFPQRLIFQRNYALITNLEKINPEAIVQSFSYAMSQISTRIIRDLHQAITNRIHNIS